jgi:hypothetical protein
MAADWSRRFADPIPLPGGGRLVTLRDAADFIQRLPPDEHDHPSVATAISVLIQVAEGSGPEMFANIAVRQMLGRHNPPRRRTRTARSQSGGATDGLSGTDEQ